MIEEEYISFETAKLAKEKGLDILCDIGYYIDSGVVDYIRDDYKNMFYPRPTQSLLARWLRGKYNKNVYVVMSITEKYIFWVLDIHSLVKVKTTDLYDTYEEAMEAGLQEALRLIK